MRGGGGGGGGARGGLQKCVRPVFVAHLTVRNKLVISNEQTSTCGLQRQYHMSLLNLVYNLGVTGIWAFTASIKTTAKIFLAAACPSATKPSTAARNRDKSACVCVSQFRPGLTVLRSLNSVDRPTTVRRPGSVQSCLPVVLLPSSFMSASTID